MAYRQRASAFAGLCVVALQAGCLGPSSGGGGGGTFFVAQDAASDAKSGDTANPADAQATDTAGAQADGAGDKPDGIGPKPEDTTQDAAAPADLEPVDSGPPDGGPPDSGPPDSGPPDSGPDVPPLGPQTIAQIQQNPESLTCPDAAKIVNTAKYKGVTVNGVVVASPVYFFKSGAKELETVYVQDQGGGPWSGAYVVSDKAEGKLTGLKAGDVVNLFVDVKEFYCYTELEPKFAVTASPLGPVQPQAYTVDLSVLGASKQAAHEQYEGVMIEIEGIVSDPLADIGNDGKPHAVAIGKTQNESTVLIGPGFGLYPQTKEGQPNYQKGQKLKVVGFWEYTFGKFRVTPLSINIL